MSAGQAFALYVFIAAAVMVGLVRYMRHREDRAEKVAAWMWWAAMGLAAFCAVVFLVVYAF
jgi:uncharacterized membrane protein